MNKTPIYMLFIVFISSYSYAIETIIINKAVIENDPRTNYTQELLTAALQVNIHKYGKFILQNSIIMNNERAKTSILRDNFGDVIHSATHDNWEKALIPIRIPIFKGIMGLRVFLINEKLKDKFISINSLTDLKKLTLGSGHVWAITEVFKQQGFMVITGTKYDSMFRMLKKERFDYLPRGLNEVLVEFELRQKENDQLMIEPSILLDIPLPVYFFVNPNKPKLAKRLTEGLNTIIENGTFDKIFNKHFYHVFEKLNIQKRKIFKLPNTNLSPETPLEKSHLWFNVNEH